MPIVYTPTVGLACQKFGLIYRRPRGLFVNIHDTGNVFNVIRNWYVFILNHIRENLIFYFPGQSMM